MTIEEVAYEIYEARTKVGYSPSRCTPETWDWEHAKLYKQFAREESPRAWITKFIGNGKR